MLRRQQPEKAEQAAIVQLLRSLGASVRVLGTRRKRGEICPKCRAFVPGDQGTRMARGLPDLLVFLPGERGCQVWIEVKSPTGRLSPDQREFAADCARTQQAHVTGGIDAVTAYLVAGGWLIAKDR